MGGLAHKKAPASGAAKRVLGLRIVAGRGLCRLRFADVDLAALELDRAVLEREDRVVAAQADV
jgi:hypothetical protein